MADANLFRGLNDKEVDELLDILTLANRLPTAELYQSGRYGDFNPNTNHLRINRQLAGPALKNILMHELTHAVDDTMNIYAAKPENKRFKEDYLKLSPYTSKLPGQNTKKNPYRYDGAEMRAHGVGNTFSTEKLNPIPGHIDSTMATEFEILKDLFKRDLTRKKK